MARVQKCVVTTTLLMIVLVHATADIMNVESKETTDSSYKWTKPSTITIMEPHNRTTEFYQDSFTSSEWTKMTKPSNKQHSTSSKIYQTTDYKTSTPSSWVDDKTDNSTYKWTNSSFPTMIPMPTVIPAAMMGVGVVVMVINALVMVVSARNSELRQNTNYNLVMGLSLSDFLMGCTSFLAGSRLLIPEFAGAVVWCIMVNLCATTSLIMSLFQTFCISLHRFLVLSENAWAQRLFDGNRKYYIYIVSWATASTLFSSLISPSRDQSKCFYSTIFGRNQNIARLILYSLSATLMALTLIFYVLTIYQVRKRYMNMSTGSDTGKMGDIKRKRVIKSIKLVSKILLALFLFTGPFNISLIFTTTPQGVTIVSFAAANFNSILNPIIYCSHITQLRNELKSMLCCKNK